MCLSHDYHGLVQSKNCFITIYLKVYTNKKIILKLSPKSIETVFLSCFITAEKKHLIDDATRKSAECIYSVPKSLKVP